MEKQAEIAPSFESLRERAERLWRTKFPDADVDANLRKLKEETAELQESPDDTSEWGDALICILISAASAGHSASDLLSFADRKLTICEGQDFVHVGDGIYKRVKTEGRS